MAPQSPNQRCGSSTSAKLNKSPRQAGPQAAESAPPKHAKPERSIHRDFSPKRESCGRHSRKCQICNHPERHSIEGDFLHWKRAGWIEERYALRGKCTIYRHARATGLDVLRRKSLSRSAEEILDKVDAVAPSASLILRAARTLASLNERGQRIKPPAGHRGASAAAPTAWFPAPSVATVRRRAPRRSPLEMIAGRRSSTSAPKSQKSVASSLVTSLSCPERSRRAPSHRRP